MTDLLELAERCEAATAEQQSGLLWEAHKLLGWENGGGAYFHHYMSVNAFTDAALTLVPEGWRWCCDTMRGEPMAFVESVKDEDKGGDLICSDWRTAVTPALAICAAALRAIAAQESNQ